MIHSPLDDGFVTRSKKKLSLEDRLAVAIEEERYEDAAKIRDEIKARDEKLNE
jgi:protein-arginine kinase activator protein McsA